MDIVLLDRHLPDSTGEALLSSFRSARPECRIALVTAIESDWEILDMDFDAYLTKPIREDELYDAVVALLQRDEQALAKNGGVIL